MNGCELNTQKLQTRYIVLKSCRPFLNPALMSEDINNTLKYEWKKSLPVVWVVLEAVCVPVVSMSCPGQ